ncbi:hypothetical protein AMTR_s01414p00005190 [Amborella trichopoda]|uniref:Uncharacterized protein n=1 Tax=Amborella trichopoda TaxID=13333 RepID=W1NXD9_AMBTC|nr:hypothetical protein AMTR_s01414p00005190 [Amborella trichopoda]
MRIRVLAMQGPTSTVHIMEPKRSGGWIGRLSNEDTRSSNARTRSASTLFGATELRLVNRSLRQ